MGKSRSSIGRETGIGETQPTEAQKFTDEEWNNVSTPEEIAELTGWEFTKTARGSYQFYDREHDMTLFIDKTMFTNGFINANSDGSNNLKSKYSDATPKDLRDIARYVQELPDNNKDATPIIIFRNQYKTNNLGTHTLQYSTWNGEYVEGHNVIINSVSFRNLNGHSLRRTLFHETSHSLDYMMGSGTNKRYSDSHGISSKQSYRDIINTDVRNAGVKGISMNSGHYQYKDMGTYYKECFADAASIVQLKELGYTNEKVTLSNGNTISVNEWINKFPNVYKATKDELSSATTSNFQKPSNYNIQNKDISNKFKVGV